MITMVTTELYYHNEHKPLKTQIKKKSFVVCQVLCHVDKKLVCCIKFKIYEMQINKERIYHVDYDIKKC